MPQGEGYSLFSSAFFHAASSISASSFGFFSTASRAETSFGVRAHKDRTHAPLPRGEGAPDSLPSLPILWSDGPLPVWMSLSSGKRGRLASNPGETGESCSGPLGFPAPTVCHPLVAGSDFSADHTPGLRCRRELYRPGVGTQRKATRSGGALYHACQPARFGQPPPSPYHFS